MPLEGRCCPKGLGPPPVVPERGQLRDGPNPPGLQLSFHSLALCHNPQLAQLLCHPLSMSCWDRPNEIGSIFFYFRAVKSLAQRGQQLAQIAQLMSTKAKTQPRSAHSQSPTPHPPPPSSAPQATGRPCHFGHGLNELQPVLADDSQLFQQTYNLGITR